MKSIITFVACMTFVVLMHAQVQDSVRSLNGIKIVSSAKDTNEIETIENDVFLIVEVVPEYPGGKEALMEYLRNNITYPKEARKANIQGTVYIGFIVEKNGSVSSVNVLRGIGGGCDEEAVRVVEGMPNWKPGTQRGKPVRVQFNLPIRFLLTDSGADKKTE